MDLIAAMRVLAAVGESGGFSAAGRTLGLAPSSVARQMDALEAAAGVTLLTRSTRRIGLTEPGRRLLAQGGRALQDLDAALAGLCDAEAAPSGLLRVTAAPSFGRSVLPVILAPFLAEHPRIDLDLVLSDALLDLDEAGIDVALRVGDPAAEPNLIVSELAPMRRVLCAGPGYLGMRGTPGAPRDLADHDCLLFRAPEHAAPWLARTDVWTLRKGGEAFEVDVTGRLSSGDADSLVAAARADLGVVVMPDWMVAGDLRQGRLIRLLEDYAVGPADDAKALHLAYPPRRRHAPRVRAFCARVRCWFAADRL